MRRIVIVGASAAGLAAAETLRREGYEHRISLVGAETLPPYDRPPLSKQILAGDWEADRLALRSEEHLADLDLDLRLGTTATGLDLAAREVTIQDGSRLEYDALVIATGVRPRRLPGEGAHVLRTLEDAIALRERIDPDTRLVVVGAGFLGAEAAAVARGLGAEVTVLEPAAVPLAHAVGAEVGAVLAQAHAENGVDLRTGVSVEAVVSGGVQLEGGELIAADEVLVAIGSLPNTEWLDDSGLAIDNGVVCDEYCVAAPGVYAAGDVARWHNPLFDASMRIEHRTNAAEQGMAVARNLLNPDAPKPFAPVPYFWSDQYAMKIQAYGYLRGHEEISIVEGDLAERRFLAAYRTGDRVSGALSVGMPPKAIRRWRQAVAGRAAWNSVAS
ncbi:NAD(P)/FAD-dependent oxidoreductase [Actinospica acidithermotolerans]|uniref:NAD(P)/FAD-dependent oxidoreductase n=1 Tax=Actinospica acidithermotolerans TaxID=2828514 RepID=UPI00201312A1